MWGNTRVLSSAETVDLLGIGFVPWTESQVVTHVMASIAGSGRRRGGWIVTPNVDILRKLVTQPAVRDVVANCSFAVADGMPLVWASAIQGTPLPERVTGASLLGTLCAAAAQHNRSVYLLGGAEGVADAAVSRLREQYPGLKVQGWSPPFGLEATSDGIQEIKASVVASGADLVFCGFGFPKQELVIAELRGAMQDAWFVGCGASLTFAAGHINRAPAWMQRSGLEWVHRLVSEPRRMFRRYIIEDIPFAVRLFAIAAVRSAIGAPAPATSAVIGMSGDHLRSVRPVPFADVAAVSAMAPAQAVVADEREIIKVSARVA